MSTLKRRQDFVTSEEGIRALQTLKSMVLDDKYKTDPSFIADTKRYPDNLISFTDKHMLYLQNNSSIDPDHYLSNLKMITRIRS